MPEKCKFTVEDFIHTFVRNLGDHRAAVAVGFKFEKQLTKAQRQELVQRVYAILQDALEMGYLLPEGLDVAPLHSVHVREMSVEENQAAFGR